MSGTHFRSEPDSDPADLIRALSAVLSRLQSGTQHLARYDHAEHSTVFMGCWSGTTHEFTIRFAPKDTP